MSAAGAFHRRRFLEGVAATTLLPAAASWGCGATDDALDGEAVYWLSSQGSDEASYGIVSAREPFMEASVITTGFRGHDVAQDPTRPTEFVLFGRRPGTTSAVADVRTGQVRAMLRAKPGHAFQGHGFFTPDGRHLLASEADTFTGAGLLTVRETESYSLVRDIDTHGIGPHEVLLMPDETTVVVANGGLLTRPETGREVLNLDAMDSSLAYLDLESGALIEQRRVSDPKSSIRHLDVTAEGTVAFGVQVQREGLDHDDLVPLAGVHEPGREPVMFSERQDVIGLMNDYVGSVAVSTSTRTAGFTSPRGDIAVFWNLDSGDYLGLHELADCSGLAASPDGAHFFLSSSFGEVRTLQATDLVELASARRRFDDVRWDNHLIAPAF